MRVLFIDDRKREIEHLIDLSGISRVNEVETYIFVSLDDCLRVVQDFDPTVIMIGYDLSSYPVTGSIVIRMLRDNGITAKIVGNSSGGAVLFENDGVQIEGSTSRCFGRIAELLA